ncbi:MAG: hypothetical protein JW969_20430 [Spirochaetales bacterium]|nr:hypothetical protein [Spirochaetales bacterium]
MKTKNIFIYISLTLLAAFALTGCPQSPGEPEEPVTFTETLYEKYVEHYGDYGPLETWLYDSDGELEEYATFVYNGSNQNTEVWIYTDDQVLDDTTLVSKILYTYTGDDLTGGELYNKSGGILVKDTYYTATYNPQGNYLTYLEKDGTDTVIENRSCTYDGTGEYYDTETYYSDEGATDKIEEYQCTYDVTDPWKYVMENHYIKIGADPDDPDYPNMDYQEYVRNLTYTYTWDSSDHMYLQSDFDDETGDMILAIMYTFEGDNRKTRSYFNQDGKLMLYRTYQYDATDFLIEIRYYNYNNSAGNELITRETFSLYTDGGNDMYEKKTYIYNYASRSRGSLDSGSSRVRIVRPECSHFFRE